MLTILSTIFFLFWGVSASTEYSDPSSIYRNSASGVVELNSINILSVLNYSTIPGVVEFYASWCGHCRAFKSIYETLVREVEHWGFLVAAVNCAHNSNQDVCDNTFKVEAYPSLKLFNCMEDSDKMKMVDMHDLASTRNVHTMRSVIAEFIINQTNCPVSLHQRKFEPSFWEDFKNRLTPYTTLILLIGEEKHRKIHYSVSLDLRHCNVFATSFILVDDFNLTKLFGAFNLPSIIGVDSDVNIRTISTNMNDYGQIRMELYLHYAAACPALEVLKTALYKPVFNTTIPEYEYDDTRSEPVSDIHMIDIISGISMALREEIPRRPFTEERRAAVLEWLKAVHECVPLPAGHRGFINDLINLSTAEGSSLDSNKWLGFLRAPVAAITFPADKTWLSCKGVTPSYRGFSCSLWLMFHTMTVNCEKPSANLHLTSKDALFAIRNYILTFFGCRGCQEHFRELTKRLKDKVNTSKDAIIFLWNGHNYVNARLRLDDSADPTAPKIQFPSERDCPSCRNTTGIPEEQKFTSNPGYDIVPITWNLRTVLSYLRAHYGPDNIRLSSNTNTTRTADLYDSDVDYPKSDK